MRDMYEDIVSFKHLGKDTQHCPYIQNPVFNSESYQKQLNFFFQKTEPAEYMLAFEYHFDDYYSPKTPGYNPDIRAERKNDLQASNSDFTFGSISDPAGLFFGIKRQQTTFPHSSLIFRGS